MSARSGLSPSHPELWQRERWEIVAGKVLLCDELTAALVALPRVKSVNLMGGKPESFSLSGNAEEQPGPREESPPPIGNPPVTAAAANLPPCNGARVDPWIAVLSVPELQTLSELVLDEIENRGAMHWGES